MTSHDHNPRDDIEFDLFLKREGELAQRLQALAQPAPSAALDAAILAEAESNLSRSVRLSRNESHDSANGAANDAAMPGTAHVRPAFLRRWQMPIGLAASLLVAVLVALQWQGQAAIDAPLQIAQAPQEQTPVFESRAEPIVEPRAEPKPIAPPQPDASSDTEPASAGNPFARERQARQPVARSAVRSIAPPVAIAQAEIPDQETREIHSAAATDAPAAAAAPPVQIAQADSPDVQERMMMSPAPAATAVAPRTAAPRAGQSQTEPGAKHPAKPWLALIEELLKADLRRDALDEWKQFRKSYPRYDVPEKLKKELDRLAEK